MNAIQPDVHQVLTECIISESSVALPPRKLDRQLYKAVNDVLEAAGGKWNRKLGVHVFARDPRPQLGLALQTGSVVNIKKETQAFYTPKAIVERVLAYTPDLTGKLVLEPSAGGGAFADELRARGATVACMELDPVSVQILREKGHKVFEGDFLEQKAPPRFDYIVMNPPFSKGQDIKHVRHAWDFLAPGASLLAIMGPGFTFQENKAATAFREFVDQHGSIVEHFPEGSFKESGTMVRTILVQLTKDI